MRELIRAACLCCLLIIAACGQKSETSAQASPTAKSADAGQAVIRIGNGAEPDTLDPQKAQGNWEADIIGKYVERLLSGRVTGSVDLELLRKTGFA